MSAMDWTRFWLSRSRSLRGLIVDPCRLQMPSKAVDDLQIVVDPVVDFSKQDVAFSRNALARMPLPPLACRCEMSTMAPESTIGPSSVPIGLKADLHRKIAAIFATGVQVAPWRHWPGPRTSAKTAVRNARYDGRATAPARAFRSAGREFRSACNQTSVRPWAFIITTRPALVIITMAFGAASMI